MLQDLQGLVPGLLRAADRETLTFAYLGPQLWKSKGGSGWEGGFPEIPLRLRRAGEGEGLQGGLEAPGWNSSLITKEEGTSPASTP